MLKKLVLLISLLLIGFIVTKSDLFKVFYATFMKGNSIIELQSGSQIYDLYVGRRYCNTDRLLKFKAFEKNLSFIENQYSFENPKSYKYSPDSKFGAITGELESGSELTIKRIFETDTFHGKDYIFQLSINNTADDNLYAVFFFMNSIKNNPISFNPSKYIVACPAATKTK